MPIKRLTDDERKARKKAHQKRFAKEHYTKSTPWVGATRGETIQLGGNHYHLHWHSCEWGSEGLRCAAHLSDDNQ